LIQCRNLSWPFSRKLFTASLRRPDYKIPGSWIQEQTRLRQGVL